MSCFLVVAHQTAQSPQLIEALHAQKRDNPAAEFVLLVPVTRYEDLRSVHKGTPREIAREAAAAAVKTLSEGGIPLRWSVISDFTPAVALDIELHDHPTEYAGVILSTYPAGVSKWLSDNLVEAVKKHGLPLTQVISQTG